MNVLDVITWLDERVQRPADLCLDSRQISSGDVFFACPGIATDGRDYIADAIGAGAAAIVCEAKDKLQLDVAVPSLIVPDLSSMLGEIAHLWYGRPSDALTVIAVTGTNGKTSTVQWIAAAMNAEGMPCGTVGTLGVSLPDGTNLGGALTTPDVLTLHRSLAAVLHAGGVAAAIEASSIGIVQGRLDGISIQVAAFTNLTRDHLDYHGSLENYKQAKFALFQGHGLRGSVVNIDDAAGKELLALENIQGHRVSYSLDAESGANFRAEEIQHNTNGLVFNLITPSGSAQILTGLVGQHNIANLLLVAGVLRELGWGLSRIARALAVLRPVPGRLQVVTAIGGNSSSKAQPMVVVDYAHTPDALQRALQSLRKVADGGRLICVFGCGGERDAGKRPLMGAIAAQFADKVVVTTDNPRSEEPMAIIDAIVAGMPNTPVIEVDRTYAILDTIWAAAEKDVILIAGKGHETYQEISGVRRPFDDRQWAAIALTLQQEVSISTDTRTLKSGELFLALKGENFDGHSYLNVAQESGAKAAIVENIQPEAKIRQIELGDTRQALIKLATAWRRRFDLPVIAVTGSNGKTTTKEMISAVLTAWHGAEHSLATLGNLNNDIGVPLTVLRLRSAHRAAVIELGMNHTGEIQLLADIAKPSVALVNNAQREHQEFLGSVANVAKENGSVLTYLPKNGVAVFPADDDYSQLWQQMSVADSSCLFGFADNSDVYASNIKAGMEQTEFTLNIGADSAAVSLHIPGRHNLRNALAAAACTASIGAPIATIAKGLSGFMPVGGRMQLMRLADGFQLIDDTYNANPDSVRAAIDVLASMDGRKILVLGDMAEVGNQTEAMHAEVGKYAFDSGIDILLTLGADSSNAASAFGTEARAFTDLDELLAELFLLRPGHVLVKGSRSMRMERIVQSLLNSPATKGDDHVA